MGNQITCKVQFGKQQSEGKALLETSEILFRGGFRLKIPFSTIQSAKAADGELRLQTAEGLAIFHLGASTEKWLDKILHPKGQKQINENDVLAAGRQTGLKDVKVVRFSPTHTALKFVVPLKLRGDSR